MGLTPPSAGELRDDLRFEQRVDGDNVGGVVTQSWSALIASRRSLVAPTRGGAEMIAGRMEGKTNYDIWIRSDALARGLTNAHRAVNNRTGEVYTLGQPIDPTKQRQWLLIQATSGGNADEQG